MHAAWKGEGGNEAGHSGEVQRRCGVAETIAPQLTELARDERTGPRRFFQLSDSTSSSWVGPASC